MFIQDYSLRKHNSFGLDVYSRYYVCIAKTSQIKEICAEVRARKLSFMIIGEGSNILFSRDYEGLIIHNCLQGIETVSENDFEILLKVSAGENWDSFVGWTVEKGLGGLENLSLIPGSVGASPVQNIGAYGVEAKDCIVQVEGFTIPGYKFMVFQNEECKFVYRSSIFKGSWKDKFLITAIVFRLQKNPVFNLAYGNVAMLFKKKSVQNLESLRETIIEIRRSKLPDISLFGNAGSFFKNPVIRVSEYNKLKEKWADIPSFPEGEGMVKVPAAWLIEKTGLKGFREGNTGIWPLQPLVLVNYGGATGKEILAFSERISASVFENFRINLISEVNIY